MFDDEPTVECAIPTLADEEYETYERYITNAYASAILSIQEISRAASESTIPAERDELITKIKCLQDLCTGALAVYGAQHS